jgi:hypothetical protein
MIFLHSSNKKNFSPNRINGLQLWLNGEVGITMTGIPETIIDDPLDITGCALWLDASLGITEAGTGVSSWADQSGNGRDFAQSTDDYRPTLIANAVGTHPAVRFTSANTDRMSCYTGLNMLQNVPGATIAVVWNPRTDYVQMMVFQATTLEGVARAGIGTGYNYTNTYDVFGRRLDSDESYDGEGGYNTRWATRIGYLSHIGILDYTNSNAYCYINGVLVGELTTFQTDGNSSDTASSYFRIGSTTYPLDGDIAEVVVYPRVLTLTEFNQLNYYFALKYPVGHGRISSWADQSGNSRDAIQTTEDLSPVLVRNKINNKQGLLFNETRQIMSAAGITGIDDLVGCTLHLVCHVGTVKTYGDDSLVFTSSNNNIRYEYYTDSTTYFYASSGRRDLGSMYLDQCHIVTIVFDGSLTDYDRLKAYVNGTLLTLTNSSSIPATLADWTSYSLHDTSVSGGNGKLMYIYEVILYNSALSDTDRHMVEHHLGTKYSIVIA